ncbi:MAG: transcriptional regulator GcvA [Betaproteobacteria bacterium]|nr:transcriptional regulator GcvA [Betaproteobacteria bacterium]
MTFRLPPMQALRAFEATARTHSLTKAAEALHVTHGAISHQIKALEEDIGVRLVERAGRGIRLTDEGERFAARVRGALAELAEAVREVAERTNPRQLRVSVVPSFAARWLIPRIGRFFAAHPDIDLDVRANNAYVDFNRDDADVAIRYGLGSWPGVIAEHVLDEVHFPVCSPRFAQGRLPERPEELSRHTLLRSEGEAWKPWFEAVGLDWPEPTRGPMFSDTAHTMQAAVDGQGIALARSTLLGSDVHNGLLVRLFDISVPGNRKYYLAYPPRLANSPKLALFRQWVLAEIAAEPSVPARGKGGRRAAPGTQARKRK